MSFFVLVAILNSHFTSATWLKEVMKYILGRHWWPDLHTTAEPLKFLMMDSKPFVSDDVSMRKLETETLARSIWITNVSQPNRVSEFTLRSANHTRVSR